mmetsp:Transcript_77263/g.226592  ORF Transcript_77263/g.226592 Transcript_77263/m.226592 type:complete len:292 (-) Transcript_77263:103-978(-)
MDQAAQQSREHGVAEELLSEGLAEGGHLQAEHVRDVHEEVLLLLVRLLESRRGLLARAGGCRASGGLVQPHPELAQVAGQVHEVRPRGALQHEALHGGVLHAVDLQRRGPDRRADHLVVVPEEADRLNVQGKLLSALIEEELDRLRIEPQRQRLEKADVVPQDLLIVPVELSAYELVDVIPAEEVVQRGVPPDVLHQHGQRLQELHLHRLRHLGDAQDAHEVRKDVLLAEEVKKVVVVPILLSPDEGFCDLPDDFHQCVAVLVVVILYVLEPVVQVLQVLYGIDWFACPVS